ncbi:uncharacterized protein [Halyomorpha halys]|uniref:uncharacterized protein n=1 Tax=Halyomorpha halys TaxID=286706 RepID=UPI0006D4FE2F|nr:protein gar2 [Halyomorpha halys]KAE8574088.1 Cuticle Protein CPR RR-2 [Halyomorpha halys]
MQVSKWLCFAASWILVATQDIYDDNPNPDTQNYQFRYYVRDEDTGDIKSQEETKQDGTVNGHYSVGEPTGDLRVVTYTADEGGFRADVKYEEGGSPASEDKARQTNSKSGVEFHWLPANPDDVQEGKTGTEDTSEGSSEGNQSGTESTTADTSDQPSESNSEATTENTSSTEAISESSTTEGSDIGSEIEKESKESDSSSETFSTESSSESSNAISETPSFSSESTTSSTESEAQNSLESSTMSSIEGKDTEQTDEENKPSTEDEQSAEAAESAPLSEEVLPPLQPSQMYLPVISYQNLPFLNVPMLENTPGYSEKPPTIIYASQNFYNPWQWFGNTRRIARDVQQHIDRHIQTSAKGFQYPVIPRQYT